MNNLTRTEMLIGTNGINKLSNTNIIIFGIGGVGSFCIESLARAGILSMHLVDDDAISITNLNRQLIATISTIGKDKVDVMKDRISDINPNIKITTSKLYYKKESSHLIDLSKYDYIIDAIDSISSKLMLVEEATRLNIPIISSMGTGNRIDPTKFIISDIFDTCMCPLARIMRSELRKKNIPSLKVVYSTEKPRVPIRIEQQIKESTPASISFVPPVVGFIIASQVVNDILNNEEVCNEKN